MRCSSCELLLDRYVEGTLSRREMTAAGAHLQSCERCSAILEELKIVDGLLFTTRASKLPENFTFAVLAETRTMAVPKPPPARVWSFLALYLAAAWVAFVIWLALTGTNVRVVADALMSAGVRVSGAANTILGSAHVVGSTASGWAALGFLALALDVALAGAAIFLFTVFRPRLAARFVHADRRVQ